MEEPLRKQKFLRFKRDGQITLADLGEIDYDHGG
jgi:hypothetical protein